MSIFNHFQHLNLSQGQENAITKLDAFLAGQAQVFMLKGYAGSGKTTILKGLVEYLKESGVKYEVMAPTGRAAKVLRDKTRIGQTIHKSIYDFENFTSIKSDSKDDSERSFHYLFPIKKCSSNKRILIVDEASMLSGVESKNELFTFGTNNLMNDLLTYASLQDSQSKIIFVGDPMQLPPVNDKESKAFIDEFFTAKNLAIASAEMKEVLRQGENLILKNATKIRELLESTQRNELQFEFDGVSFIETNYNETIEKYVELYPQPEIGDGIVISFSNTQCLNYNNSIRSKLFPNQQALVPGDLLLINQNNYHAYSTELFNGDIVKVVSVDSNTEKISAPVMCDVDGERVRKNIELIIRKMVFRINTYPNDIECYYIDSLLNSVNRELSIEEMKALYINFVIRFNEKQKENKEKGLPSFSVDSEEFKQALKKDKYYNALRVKYGYAITCHKAQGGEWNTVFVDYSGRVSLAEFPLRWCYTATTRGVYTLYAINSPNFGKFTELKFSQVGNIGNLPSNSIDFNRIPLSPFHKESDHKGKSLKYWQVAEKLENTEFEILSVVTFGFLEKYTIRKGELLFIIEASHKGSGHFIDLFKVKTIGIPDDVRLEIEAIFNSRSNTFFTLDYKPSKAFLSKMYSRIQSICLDLDILITNVVEDKYFVNYYFVTDSICSYIQFYFGDNGCFTTAMPKTFNCIDDAKLKILIYKLESYAI